jgi:hypothetical protein
MSLTKADWGKIHARAYKDSAFRHKLETDPTAAVREWHSVEYKDKKLDKIVDLSEWDKAKASADDGDWPPPACC